MFVLRLSTKFLGLLKFLCRCEEEEASSDAGDTASHNVLIPHAIFSTRVDSYAGRDWLAATVVLTKDGFVKICLDLKAAG